MQAAMLNVRFLVLSGTSAGLLRPQIGSIKNEFNQVLCASTAKLGKLQHCAGGCCILRWNLASYVTF